MRSAKCSTQYRCFSFFAFRHALRSSLTSSSGINNNATSSRRIVPPFGKFVAKNAYVSFGAPITDPVTDEMMDAAVGTLAAYAIRNNPQMSDFAFRYNVGRMIGEALSVRVPPSEWQTYIRVTRGLRTTAVDTGAAPRSLGGA